MCHPPNFEWWETDTPKEMKNKQIIMCFVYSVKRGGWFGLIQNNVVQSIRLQGNRGGTGKSRQNSQGTGIATLAGAALLMEATL